MHQKITVEVNSCFYHHVEIQFHFGGIVDVEHVQNLDIMLMSCAGRVGVSHSHDLFIEKNHVWKMMYLSSWWSWDTYCYIVYVLCWVSLLTLAIHNLCQLTMKWTLQRIKFLLY